MANLLLPRRRRHAHFTVIAAAASILNAVAILVLTTSAHSMGPGYVSWIAEWWGLVEGIVVLLQLPPLVGSGPLEERKEVLEVISSPLDAGIVWLVIPAVYLVSVHFNGGIFGPGWYWPNYWAFKIWLTSVPASLTDLMLLLVLIEVAKTVQRIQPNP